jgi:hypothetical protein
MKGAGWSVSWRRPTRAPDASFALLRTGLAPSRTSAFTSWSLARW